MGEQKGETPVVNIYNYKPSNHLSILKFNEMNDAWLDFIVQCRSGNCQYWQFLFHVQNKQKYHRKQYSMYLVQRNTTFHMGILEF